MNATIKTKFNEFKDNGKLERTIGVILISATFVLTSAWYLTHKKAPLEMDAKEYPTFEEQYATVEEKRILVKDYVVTPITQNDLVKGTDFSSIEIVGANDTVVPNVDESSNEPQVTPIVETIAMTSNNSKTTETKETSTQTTSNSNNTSNSSTSSQSNDDTKVIEKENTTSSDNNTTTTVPKEEITEPSTDSPFLRDREILGTPGQVEETPLNTGEHGIPGEGDKF